MQRISPEQGRRVSRWTYWVLLFCLAVLPLGLTAGCESRQKESRRFIDDQTISARVKSDLLRDPVVPGSNIYVSTYQREVQLSGFVATPGEKTRAGRIAASVPGVKDVHNDILVRTGR